MISYSIYKIVHLLGILTVFSALGGLALHVINGGSRKFSSKKWVMILHGLGLFLTLLGGFGLLARIGVTGGWPFWVWGKLAIWLILGGAAAAVLRKKQGPARLAWIGLLVLGAIAAYLANYKPVL